MDTLVLLSTRAVCRPLRHRLWQVPSQFRGKGNAPQATGRQNGMPGSQQLWSTVHRGDPEASACPMDPLCYLSHCKYWSLHCFQQLQLLNSWNESLEAPDVHPSISGCTWLGIWAWGEFLPSWLAHALGRMLSTSTSSPHGLIWYIKYLALNL